MIGPVSRSIDSASQGSAGIQATVLAKEISALIGTDEVRSNRLMTYEGVQNRITASEVKKRDEVLVQLQAGQITSAQALEKLEKIQITHDAQRQRAKEIFKPLTGWDLLAGYAKAWALFILLGCPFFLFLFWSSIHPKLKMFAWKFPVYNIALVGVCAFAYFMFLQQIHALWGYSPQFLIATLIAGVMLTSGIALKDDFKGWHIWTKRFVYMGLAGCLFGLIALTGFDITRPNYSRVIDNPGTWSSYTETLYELIGPKPTAPLGGGAISLDSLKSLISNISGQQAVNVSQQFTPVAAGTLEFKPNQHKRVGKLQGEKFISFDSEILYSWDTGSSKRWKKLPAGQKLPRDRVLYVNKASERTVKYKVWKRTQ
ncbi:MAG: hypothetical protein ACPGO5_04715 [Patescibacteria group bacterium]